MPNALQVAGGIAALLNRVFGSRAGNRVGVFAYHRVQPRRTTAPAATFNVTPEQFREQLSGLVAMGFQFLKMSTVFSAVRQNSTLPPRSVVVTFDDAFASVFHEAYPVLQDLQIPATAFLSTAYTGSTGPFPFDLWGMNYSQSVPALDYRPLSLDECHALAAGGLFEFGAHTHTHRDFRGHPKEFARDVSHSVRQIREWFGVHDVTFAFPYGKTSQGFAGGELSRAARLAGTCCALTTDCRLIDHLHDDPWQWGRINVLPTDSATTLSAKLAGWYDWAPQLRAAVDHACGFDRSSDFVPPLDPPDLPPEPVESVDTPCSFTANTHGSLH